MSRIETADFRLFRISEQKRAISSECAPRSWKKLSSTETRSIFMTSISARASAASVSLRGATILALPAEKRGPLGAGRFFRSALWLDDIGMMGSSSI